MSERTKKARSVNQRVGNEGRNRNLGRDDAFVAYVMDRFLFRLGRSSQADEFFLKGGLLVANLVAQPHRFTRDIDFLRRNGPPGSSARRSAVSALKSASTSASATPSSRTSSAARWRRA
jgi:hypothetical protein